jgi:hypothetical protein
LGKHHRRNTFPILMQHPRHVSFPTQKESRSGYTFLIIVHINGVATIKMVIHQFFHHLLRMSFSRHFWVRRPLIHEDLQCLTLCFHQQIQLHSTPVLLSLMNYTLLELFQN